MRRFRAAAMAACGATAWLAAGCFERHTPAYADRPGLVDSVFSDTGAAAAARLQLGGLATVPAAPVEGLKGPGGRPFDVTERTSAREAGHARRFGSVTLQTSLRDRAIGQYPCTSCHLGSKVVMRDKRIAHVHENIQPVHPSETGAVCSTCHAEEDVGMLPLKDGGRAPLEQAYRLCAQCHFQQVRDWAGGGHGKRLEGWEGQRVVMGCADCHDPHKPAIEPRVPFRAPQLEPARAER
jgi:hypothetical protein